MNQSLKRLKVAIDLESIVCPIALPKHRRTLVYFCVVLGCDTPILEALFLTNWAIIGCKDESVFISHLKETLQYEFVAYRPYRVSRNPLKQWTNANRSVCVAYIESTVVRVLTGRPFNFKAAFEVCINCGIINTMTTYCQSYEIIHWGTLSKFLEEQIARVEKSKF